ncbi:VanZ family protein [Corynebacterium sp.]|uniref:VanZ family protein n=1 Tax=Corynebacterium sp. TaxID=1720 RepID=UPI0026DBF28B|nr:VanZ family protein [Corynebacterium sp.]MDO5032622.1 VanZ family protein [Corynebacterium sp.]
MSPSPVSSPRTVAAHPRNRLGSLQRPADGLRLRALLALIPVLAVVGLLTLGKPFMEVPGLIDGHAHAVRSIDLQMFNGFEDPPIWYGPWTNTLGNIALFMPLAATLLAAGRTGSRLRFGVGGTILLCVLLSVGIEVTQYIGALGFSDIDDLVFNSLGAVLGAVMMSRLGSQRQRSVVRYCGLGAAVLAAGIIAVILL